jgi:hypothetical protein
MSIPVAEEKLTIKQQKKARRDAFYKLKVDLAGSVKSLTNQMDADQLEKILEAYVQMLRLAPNKDEPTTEVEVDVMRQMSLFAATTLSNVLIKRYS